MSHSRIDLINGKISSVIPKLAIPVIITSIIQMAYSFVDTIWVGKLSASAVAAVGTGGVFIWLSQGFAVIASTGGQSRIANAIGRGDKESVKKLVSASFQIAIICGITIGAILFFTKTQLVEFFQFKDISTFNFTKTYLSVISFFILPFCLSMCSIGMMAAIGNTKYTFKIISIGLIVNIILDPIMIFSLNLGVFGAALATLIAEILISSLYIYFVFQYDIYRGCKIFHKVEWKYFKEILKVGLPASLQIIVYAGVSLTMTRIIARFGDAAVAAQKVGAQLESLSWMTGDGMALALNSFVAQNNGANKLSRCIKGYKFSIKVMVCISSITMFAFIFGSNILANIFFHEQNAINSLIGYLGILALSQIFIVLEIISSAAFAGFGASYISAILISFFTLIRIPISILMSATPLKELGIWWTFTGTSTLLGITSVIWFLLFFNKKLKNIKK